MKSRKILNSPQNIYLRLPLELVLELFWQNMLQLGHFGCYLEFVLASISLMLIFVLCIKILFLC